MWWPNMLCWWNSWASIVVGRRTARCYLVVKGTALMRCAMLLQRCVVSLSSVCHCVCVYVFHKVVSSVLRCELLVVLLRGPTREWFRVSQSPARCLMYTFINWTYHRFFLFPYRSAPFVSSSVDWLRLVGWEKGTFFPLSFTLNMALNFLEHLCWVRGQDSIAVFCHRPRISIVKVAYKADWDLVRNDRVDQDFYRERKLAWRTLVLFWNRNRIDIAKIAFKHHSYKEGDIEQNQHRWDLVRLLAKGNTEVLL